MALFLNGRVTVYTEQVPYEADVLRSNLYNMVGVSGLADTVLGFGISESTTVRGLPCTPVVPPGLAVVIGPGVMYSYQFLDATDYGVLPADTNPNHKLYKQAFNFDPVTLSLTAPSTPGNSVIYLIQGIFSTQDVNIISRPYYNSADPADPIFNNNSDTRTDLITLNAKQGTPGVSPSPPSPDSGYTALYYVTVTNGQTSIISGNISKVSTTEGQPFITEGLTQKVSSATIAAGYVSIINQRNNTYVFGMDVGSVNSIVINPTNAYGAYVTGTGIEFVVANTNTGATTANISGQGAIAIKVATPLGFKDTVGGEMISGLIYNIMKTGSVWQLMNPSTFRSISAQVKLSNTQSVVAGDLAKLLFATVDFDSFSLWDATNHWFVFPLIGRWRVSGYAKGYGANGGHGLVIGGTASFADEIDQQEISPTADLVLNGTKILYASAVGQTAFLQWANGTVSSINVGNGIGGFEIQYLGN